MLMKKKKKNKKNLKHYKKFVKKLRLSIFGLHFDIGKQFAESWRK